MHTAVPTLGVKSELQLPASATATAILNLSQFFFCFFLVFFVFLGLHLQHMEVPRLEVRSELQLLPYTTATTTRDPSHICSLHHSSQQCQILNSLREARD